MRNWEEQMKGYGAKLLDAGLIVNLTPEGESAEECRALGKQLAKSH